MPRPAPAEWPPHGLEETRAAALIYGESDEPVAPATPQEKGIVAEWSARRDAILSATSPDPNKVPEYKFECDEGWIVTPREARTIAKALRSTLSSRPHAFTDALAQLEGVKLEPSEALQWIRAWATYNELAVAHGGYRVE